MMKTHWFVLAIAALLILSACDAQAPSTDTPSDGSPAADGPESDNAAPPAQDGPEGNGADKGAADKFLEYLAGKTRLEWKIDYDLDTTVDGERTTMRMSQYLKGLDKMRMDTTVPEYGESRTYILKDEYVTCYKQDGAWSCMRLTAGDDTIETQQEFEESVQEDESDYDIGFDGTKQIAGVTATCFKVTSTQEEFSMMRYCFSKEGAPLYLLIEGSAEDASFRSEMTATSYATRVSDSDFVPPAEPTEFGAGFGAGGTMPAGGDESFCDYCNYLSGSEKADCLASC